MKCEMRVHRHGGTIFLLSVILLSPMHCTLNPEARAECRGVLRAEMNTSLAAKAALAHRLQNPKCPPGEKVATEGKKKKKKQEKGKD